jgi:hypothetical protein
VLYTANNAVSAARDGARIAATMQSICTVSGGIQDTVVNHFSAYRFGGGPLHRDSVSVTVLPAGSCATPPTATPSSVRVAVSYPFTWIIPIPKLACLAQRAAGCSGSNTRAVHAAAEYRYEF